MDWPFGNLKPLTYDVIIADPPTPFDVWSEKGNGKSPDAHYDTMSWDDLGRLPVSKLGRGDTYLMLWACWPTLRQSLDLLSAWGFRYVTGGAWHKRTKTGKSAFGTGYVLRSATEPFLIGTLGSPRSSRKVRGVIDAITRGHSRKPDEQYSFCEQLCPDAVRFAELFARQEWPGWDAWGNEVGKFEAETAA